MKKILFLVTSLILGAVLAGCQYGSNENTENTLASISGTVAYRERIALPEQAVVSISLQDVSLADAPAKVIATQRIETQGKQVPFDFELAYDASKIIAQNRYSVSARIEVDGQLLFITDMYYGVITDAAHTTQVDLNLVGVRH
ncbi:YbaY family lipoprotein [Vibrio cincinnatiensis]|uniref:Putative lipoprotein n=1 Tax=Vibrio cincinnatiensis DSM 19608 TaxID=1123491 RepID=A0A1T4L5Q4_VIBCI|nr:YbaY family lipoprotein [Vibrio cincinnatiensis]MCG3733976.1 lipo-like protein [Vibrio cincinnatiensis]MCG3736889.1 lipo-like protein [Vibrio cincinnatiensis]MCG3738296.1 lipo-like protein [Vibrio cincinnatiensis]MCG3743683.1 lipo-like protein [Vibrio cincinnatiensis]MCG3747426.1 lipo-like protein [Vibrio cincinnatiensis]